MSELVFRITSNHINTKNRLQKEFEKFILTLDRSLIMGAELTGFMNDLKKQIKVLNEKHKTSNPIVLSAMNHNGVKELYFTSTGYRMNAEVIATHRQWIPYFQNLTKS